MHTSATFCQCSSDQFNKTKNYFVGHKWHGRECNVFSDKETMPTMFLVWQLDVPHHGHCRLPLVKGIMFVISSQEVQKSETVKMWKKSKLM